MLMVELPQVLLDNKINIMERICFKMKLIPGNTDEYKRRHDEIWPELSTLLKSNGISDYSIFLDETSNELVGFLKIIDPSKIDELPSNPIMKKWWSFMQDIMETNADHSPLSLPLKEVFYLP